jgi:sigma-B regulation protein RsbU (phosphoserine phosphatase)
MCADRLSVESSRGGDAGHFEQTHLTNEIAARLQSSVLPGDIEIEGLGISGGMWPAEVVGGDYYDIIPVQDGCWLAVGDVAANGLAAGIIMLMMQSTVQSLVNLSPQGNPRDMVCALNAVLYENVRERMKREDHVTFCLARYRADGALVFAGAHENILIFRAGAGAFESIRSNGASLGTTRDVRSVISQTTVQLDAGDLMVLFTDGVIQTRNEKGEAFGLERFCEHIMRGREASPRHIRKDVIDALLDWNPRPDDDITLVVVRCRGVHRDKR